MTVYIVVYLTYGTVARAAAYASEEVARSMAADWEQQNPEYSVNLYSNVVEGI